MEKIKKEKFKIAVIEDDEILAKSLAEELEDAGFAVVKAVDGLNGLELILSQKPDLVLLDIILPKMDGMTMLAKLRESGDYGKSLPVIILTNLNADEKIMHGVVKDEPAYYLIKTDHTVADVVDKVKERLSDGE